MNDRQRNIVIAPLVIFVRVPLLFPLWLVARVGEAAERVLLVVSDYLPGWKV